MHTITAQFKPHSVKLPQSLKDTTIEFKSTWKYFSFAESDVLSRDSIV